MSRTYKISLIVVVLCLSFYVQATRLVVCQMLDLGEFRYMPLMGVLDGHAPHVLYRIAHNLINPLLWVGYGAIIFWWRLATQRGGGSRALDRIAAVVAVVHALLVVFYIGSSVLPIGDMVMEIAP